MKSIAANPTTDTRPPNTRVPAPRSTIDTSRSLIGGTRSFSPCATISPSTPPINPTPPERSVGTWLSSPFDEILRVQREHEEPEPPELVAEHLEPGQSHGGRGASCDFTDAVRDRAEDPAGLLGETGHVCACLHVSEPGCCQCPDREDPAPPTTTSHAGRNPPAASATAIPRMEECAAGLRHGVPLEEVTAGQDIGDRSRFHGERHADHRLRGEQREDERGGGARISLGRALPEREEDRDRDHPHHGRRHEVRPPRPVVVRTDRSRRR